MHVGCGTAPYRKTSQAVQAAFMNLSKEQLAELCAELAPALRNGVVQEVRQSDTHTFQFAVRKPGRTFFLEVGVLPRYCRVLAVTRKKPCLTPAPAFLAKLRRELDGARLLDVEMPWDDRVVVVTLLRQSAGLQLIAELTGHHANLFLIDETGLIVASLLPSSSHQRQLLAGNPYEPPPDAQPAAVPEAQSEVAWNADVILPLSMEFEEFYEQELGHLQFQSRQKQLADAAKKQVERVAKRLTNLQTDLARLGDPGKLQHAGELLKSSLGQIRRGMEQIRVEDYFQEEAPEVVLALKPELDARQNLAWYFDRYKRAQRGAATIRQRIVDSQAELELLQARLKSLWVCTTLQQLEQEEARHTLAAKAGAYSSKNSTARRAAKAAASVRHKAFKTFLAATGRQILVGKGGKDNHELTFKVSSPHDIWLHVRGFPGSHVIVPLAREQEIDPETLVDAAHLALHYIQAPQEGYNEVIWTRRKWVKAVKGAAPGKVQVTQERTVQITLESGRMKRLLESQVEG